MDTIRAGVILTAIAMTGASADQITLREETRLGDSTRATVEMKAEGTFKPATLPGAPESKPLALKVETRLEFAERVASLDGQGQARRTIRQVDQAAATINGEVRPSSSAL